MGAYYPPIPHSLVRDHSQGPVTSQAGFSNLNNMNIMLTFQVNGYKSVIYMAYSLNFDVVYAI